MSGELDLQELRERPPITVRTNAGADLEFVNVSEEELAALIARASVATPSFAINEIDRLREENARLREELQKAATALAQGAGE